MEEKLQLGVVLALVAQVLEAALLLVIMLIGDIQITLQSLSMMWKVWMLMEVVEEQVSAVLVIPVQVILRLTKNFSMKIVSTL